MPDLSERLRAYRKEHGLSQEELAYTVGVRLSTLSRWERGVSHPRGLQKQTIERILEEGEKK